MIEMKTKVIVPMIKGQCKRREDSGRRDSDEHGGRKEKR
jgi:hypothetical protein